MSPITPLLLPLIAFHLADEVVARLFFSNAGLIRLARSVLSSKMDSEARVGETSGNEKHFCQCLYGKFKL